MVGISSNICPTFSLHLGIPTWAEQSWGGGFSILQSPEHKLVVKEHNLRMK